MIRKELAGLVLSTLAGGANELAILNDWLAENDQWGEQKEELIE